MTNQDRQGVRETGENGLGEGRDAASVDSATAEAVAVCDGVTHVYRRASRSQWGRTKDGPAVNALEDVSLRLFSGEMTAVTGPSGSGKSTLVHLMAALDTPTKGTVRISGTDTATLSERGRTRLRRNHVGLVFQRFHLLPALTARGNVALPLIEQGLGRRERRERAEAVLERVGLGDRLDHKPGQLSGGEQQRVAVARALVSDPDVLLADEPTGELDTRTGERILDVIGSTAADRGVLIASHDRRVVERADRVVRLRDGQVRDEGHAGE